MEVAVRQLRVLRRAPFSVDIPAKTPDRDNRVSDKPRSLHFRPGSVVDVSPAEWEHIKRSPWASSFELIQTRSKVAAPAPASFQRPSKKPKAKKEKPQ